MKEKEIKTLRIFGNTHSEVLKIQGAIQAKLGEPITIDCAIMRMVESYKKCGKSKEI